MTQKSVRQFNNEYEKFSNFYPCTVFFEGRNYPTVEHAFQAAKSKSWKFRKKVSDVPVDKAGKAKRLGRGIRLRHDWEMVKISVMRKLLMQKFSLDEFKTLLISTGDADITEGNYWHDNDWGDCFCAKCKDIKGKNNLGKLLMKIRAL
jgi:ribA/ribD-fused uncharacterized protein